MIVARVVTGVWNHAGARVTEWIGAIPLIGMGVVFLTGGDIFSISASFALLAAWATQGTWANILLSGGLARVCALIVNGSFPVSYRYSPIVRFLASWLAMLIWSAIALAMYAAWREVGGDPTGMVAYGTLALMELRNVYSARVDMVLTRRS